MAEFPVNPHRLDPYKNFKFRVKWDGRYVPGVSRISSLRRTTEVVLHREGGEPSLDLRAPGLTSYDAIVLEQGRTQDTAFEDWANLLWTRGAGAGAEVRLKEFREDVYIELQNEAGQIVLAFRLFRCWPSDYVALSNLIANGEAAVAIESITLQTEGWERDRSVMEPAEP